jgi:D-serine deaminase-like pyridoxal phosphate-dependent protein
MLARRSSSLRYAGLHAYHGGAQHLRTADARRAAITQAATLLQDTRRLLAAADLTPPLITGAGTGTFAHEAASGLWGEIQPGSFLFMDADYLGNEPDPAQPAFEAALYLKSQVISVAADHAVCDAGHKSHAIDSGLPRVAALPGQPALQFANGGDEHGILRPASESGALPALGDTVWLIPGHCDPTVNLHRHFIAVRGGLAGGTVEAVVPVQARGVW